MPKSKSTPCLPQHMLLQLANTIANRYGFRRVLPGELSWLYSNTKIPLPIVLRNRDGTLWVDRYYMALQLGDGDVRYIYLTEQHIREEMFSYRTLKNCHDDPAELPRDIAAQFRLALRRMRATMVPIYVSSEVLGLGLAWAETLYEKIWPDRSKPD